MLCSVAKDEPEAEDDKQPEEKKQKVDKSLSRHHKALLQLFADELKTKPENIAEFDMCLMDVVPSCFVGIHEEFVSAPRVRILN